MIMRVSPSFRSIITALLIALPLPAFAETPSATSGEVKPFSSMAVTPDAEESCRAPRPPADLAETAYLRNGYRAILRIMAAEKWQQTGSCECFLTQLTWEEVVERSEEFKISDNDRRPFDVSELRLRADAMLFERDEACAE